MREHEVRAGEPILLPFDAFLRIAAGLPCRGIVDSADLADLLCGPGSRLFRAGDGAAWAAESTLIRAGALLGVLELPASSETAERDRPPGLDPGRILVRVSQGTAPAPVLWRPEIELAETAAPSSSGGGGGDWLEGVAIPGEALEWEPGVTGPGIDFLPASAFETEPPAGTQASLGLFPEGGGEPLRMLDARVEVAFADMCRLAVRPSGEGDPASFPQVENTVVRIRWEQDDPRPGGQATLGAVWLSSFLQRTGDATAAGGWLERMPAALDDLGVDVGDYPSATRACAATATGSGLFPETAAGISHEAPQGACAETGSLGWAAWLALRTHLAATSPELCTGEYLASLRSQARGLLEDSRRLLRTGAGAEREIEFVLSEYLERSGG